MDAYIYRAALYCEPCAKNVAQSLTKPADHLQGPYAQGGGEADCPQHCACCGRFLENPLTPDGLEYVRSILSSEQRRTGTMARQWGKYYGDIL